MKTMEQSTLTKKQVRTYGPRKLGTDYIKAEVRHDDECGNGHNSFAITAEIYDPHYRSHEPRIAIGGKSYYLGACGCCHDEVAKAFPELEPFIKWHLSSTDGPMHYIANALYWAGHKGFRDGERNSPPSLEHLKSTIVYGALKSDKDFDLADCMYSDDRGFSWNDANAAKLQSWLESRLEALQAAFRADVEKLGLIW